MGQQPNIEITLADLPTSRLQPAPARRWSPSRPGELGAPGDVPWGGPFGTPAPDAGYARALAARRDLALVDGERRADAEAAVAAVAGARASSYGRGPTPRDVEVAATILAYDKAGVPAAVADRISTERLRRVADLARRPHKAADLIASIPLEVLVADLESVRAAVADGAVL